MLRNPTFDLHVIPEPRRQTCTYRVRYDECDPYERLNNANYARYMADAAFSASAAAGYDRLRYAEIGRYWWVRETGIHFLSPVRSGDTLDIHTWVVDFRRASSRRAYEIVHHGSQQLVARAYSDWVFLATDAIRPVKIPAEMIGAFFPRGAPAAYAERQPFRDPPSPPENAFRSRRQVTWQDLDPMGHVNNATYLGYMEDCSVQALEAGGWPLRRMDEQGSALAACSQHIQYLQQALYGDELEITTWVERAWRAALLQHFVIRRARDGALVAQCHQVNTWLGQQEGWPRRIPPGFLADLAPHLAPSRT